MAARSIRRIEASRRCRSTTHIRIKGGQSWGLTMPSDPPLFSPEWWELFSWFLKQARARGMAVSLSDYTLGWAGNGWYMDEILRDHPDMHGAELERVVVECSGECAWQAPRKYS